MLKRAVPAAFVVLLSSLWIFGESPLVTACRSGKIVLSPDPDFGRGVDWEPLVLHFADDITVAPDGSIFVANNREHAILKFDSNGLPVRKFGRKGQGPERPPQASRTPSRVGNLSRSSSSIPAPSRS